MSAAPDSQSDSSRSSSPEPSEASSSSSSSKLTAKQAAEAKEASNVPIKPPPEPREKGVHIVLPYLLMGSADVAVNKDELKYLGVKHIMNCASEDVDNMFEEDFEYTSYPIEDTHEGEPSQHFEDSFNVISKCKEERKLIFVHCTEGKNISPTIVLAYMMRSAKNQNKHLPLKQAHAWLGTKAPGIKVSDQFMQQLIDLEEELFDEVSVRLKSGGRFGGGSRVGVGRGGRGGRGGKGKRGK